MKHVEKSTVFTSSRCIIVKMLEASNASKYLPISSSPDCRIGRNFASWDMLMSYTPDIPAI